MCWASLEWMRVVDMYSSCVQHFVWVAAGWKAGQAERGGTGACTACACPACACPACAHPRRASLPTIGGPPPPTKKIGGLASSTALTCMASTISCCENGWVGWGGRSPGPALHAFPPTAAHKGLRCSPRTQAPPRSSQMKLEVLGVCGEWSGQSARAAAGSATAAARRTRARHAPARPPIPRTQVEVLMVLWGGTWGVSGMAAAALGVRTWRRAPPPARTPPRRPPLQPHRRLTGLLSRYRRSRSRPWTCRGGMGFSGNFAPTPTSA